MAFIRRHFLTVAALGMALACSSSNPTKVVTSTFTVTASPGSAVADGVSTITIHVDGTSKPPIRIATNRGTFDNGTSSATFDATPFDATLYSCDASQVPACAGSTVIQVVDASLGTGATQVVFTNPLPDTSGGGSTDGGSDGGTGTGTDGGTPDGGGTPTSYSIAAVASSTRIPADGSATALITAAVSAGTQPAAGRTVVFSQSGTAAKLSAASGVTNSAGIASVVFTSAASGGTTTVTATDTASGQQATVTITMPKLGQVKLQAQQFGVQGVRGSGYQEVNQLTFALLDNAGLPYPAGLTVNFSHQSVGGSYIGGVASCSTAIPATCTASATTDGSGLATVLLTSGRTAGVASVTATATAGQTTTSGTASNLAFIGAKSSGAHITIDCTPKNIPALSSTDCNFSHYVGSTITCKATFADRFNNVLGVPTLATFASEAGSAGPPASTDQNGVATEFINVTGGKLPVDVKPFDGEYSFSYADACGNLTRNPRDGLVTVIVMANGEEGFVDLNGNGSYDPGEPFIDMGEPYLDVNDNGQWDPGEPYWDVNGNNKYDGPNGVWDANTVIWAETRVLFTGQPQAAIASGMQDFSRFFASGTLPNPTATSSFSLLGPIAGAAPQPFSVAFMDVNFNPIAPSSKPTIGTAGAGVATVAITQDFTLLDSIGTSFTQQYCDSPTSPTSCSNVCNTVPCYVVTNVGACDLPARKNCTGFPFGASAPAATIASGTVSGACATTSSDKLQASTTIGGVKTTISADVSCGPCANNLAACGAACVDVTIDPKNCGACGNTCGGAQTCQSGTCVDPGGTVSQYAVQVTASPAIIPAVYDPQITSTITATVKANGVAVQGRTVQFSVQAGSGGGATLSSSSGVTNANGQVVVSLYADPQGGTATVVATDASSSQQGTTTVYMPQLGQVNFVSSQYQVQGVRFSGYQETNLLTFQLLDSAGQPYPPGLKVDFTHQSLNGSYIGATANCTNAVPSICSASATTDGSGRVMVYLTSGRSAGVVSVSGSATAGGLTTSGVAKNLAIVGAKANGLHITLDCTPRNIPALMDNDCSFSHYSFPFGSNITCTATLADRFNNVLGIPTLVTFDSEAGSAGPPTWTPTYDATKLPSGQTGLGVAYDYINVTGGKLPMDVAPFQGEFSSAFTDKCGSRIHNPRDGLVTIVAMANGEEGFVDLNGNGKYDPGEPFVDVGEPYIDMNDNGQWDPGEPFWDLNQNGQYDPPNGQWDANTVIWAETRILYTDVAMVAGSGVADLLSRFFDGYAAVSGFPSPPAPKGFATPYNVNGTVTGPTPGTRHVVFMDSNFNPMTSIATYDVTTLGSGAASLKVPYVWDQIDHLGMTFTQQYCDKPMCDPSVPGARCGASSVPTICSNDPYAACVSGPCYVVTNVGTCDLTSPSRPSCTGFGYGTYNDVVATGSCSKNASDTVMATATVNGVVTTVSVGLTCTP